MIRPPELPAAIMKMIQTPTPPEFIKTRKGKGNKEFTYIEGGYVIAQLNKIFSPLGWEVIYRDRLIDPNVVVVTATLTIKHFKTGYQVSKESSGAKDRVSGISLGDTIKAAETDALKKAASKFGIGLDVYWGQLDVDKLPKGATGVMDKDLFDEPKKPGAKEKVKQEQAKELKIFEAAMRKVKSENDITILGAYRQNIQSFEGLMSDAHKHQVLKAIDEKLGKKTDGNKLFN